MRLQPKLCQFVLHGSRIVKTRVLTEKRAGMSRGRGGYVDAAAADSSSVGAANAWKAAVAARLARLYPQHTVTWIWRCLQARAPLPHKSCLPHTFVVLILVKRLESVTGQHMHPLFLALPARSMPGGSPGIQTRPCTGGDASCRQGTCMMVCCMPQEALNSLERTFPCTKGMVTWQAVGLGAMGVSLLLLLAYLFHASHSEARTLRLQARLPRPRARQTPGQGMLFPLVCRAWYFAPSTWTTQQVMVIGCLLLIPRAKLWDYRLSGVALGLCRQEIICSD